MKRTSAVLLAALIIALVSGLCLTAVPSTSLAAQAAPGFSCPSVGGGSVSLASLKGKVVVLNFFTTFCPYCIKEVPDLNALNRDYSVRGVQVIGMGLDSTAKQLERFAADNKVRYPVAVCPETVRSAYADIPRTGGLRGVPTTVVIGPNGQVAWVWPGYVDKDELERQVRRLLPSF
jgi:peroxiredoxin